MRLNKTLMFLVFSCFAYLANAQGDVYVNMNMVHWVDTVSDFGRDRHLVLHADPTEDDWKNEGDKLDYLVNDLDAYFGRDNGYASWYCSQTPQDPNKSNWFDYEWMRETGGPAAKNNYAQLAKRTQGHQFDRKGHMIMGTNPQPLYPSLGTDAGLGWMPLTVETSAQWQGEYLDNYFSKGEGDAGLPIPEYWEVVNEIDMVMNLHASYLITNYENVWKYHNLSAEAIKSKLGDKAPKVGGMTWGMHDFHRGDGVTNRALGVEGDKDAGYGWSAHEDMYLSDLERNNYFTDWYQWDCYWQGFMKHCGDNMDYHSVHIYDWPEYEQNAPTVRAGGHTEAMLDMIEWYDIKMGSGEPKEIVISEYGAVAGEYNAGLFGKDDDRRDWENLKPFNSMLMQFLERPNTVRITSQFTPIIAHWGDGLISAGVRYPYKMLDDVDGDGDYDWTQFIKFYELWSDVDGTRIETKSTDVDVQVDAYVDGKHMYLILNNMVEAERTLAMHYYDDDNTAVTNVSIKDLWLNEAIGKGKPTLTEYSVKTLPGEITLKADATMILDIEFASALELDKTVREYKLMGNQLNTSGIITDAGTEKFTIDSKQNPTQTMSISNVPAFSGSDEVKLRITGSFFNDPQASHISTLSVKVNGNTISAAKKYRGEMKAKHNLCLATIEVDVPLAYLKEGDNDITVSYGNTAGFACCQLQYWKFSDAPGRGADNIAVTGVTVPSTLTMQVGETNSIAAAIAPANASDKTITWTSDDASVEVDKYGVLTAKSTGSAKITATCGGQSDDCTVTVDAFDPTAATGASIEGPASIEIGHNLFHRLTPVVTPAGAAIQSITWSSLDETVAKVYDNGTVNGIEIGGSTTITATVKDKSGHTHQASVLVTVGVAGGEYVSCAGIEDTVSANTSYDFTVTVNALKDRDIKIELLQGATVIGTGTSSVVKDGMSRIKIPMTTTIVPTEGNYTLKGYLLDGASELSTNEEPLYVQTVVPDSIAIVDWLWEVEKNGGTLQIEATVFPEEAFNKTIIWTSSDDTKATVDADGLVTGQTNTGLVTITATTEAGNVIRDINIDVKDDLVVTATGISLNDVVNVFPGTTHEVFVEYDPSWATDKDITWTVTDESVVKFTTGNTLQVLGADGTSTTITGKYTSNNSLTVSATVRVSDVIVVEAEEFDATGGSYDDDADGGTAVTGAGANTYTVSGKGGINYINSGDWMTYPVYVPETGMYNISFYAGTEAAITDGVINFKVDGESLGTVTVKNQGWDNFQLVTINDVYIEKGSKTVTIEAVGGSLYQWNMEHFEIEMAGPVAVTGVEVTPEEWKALVDGTKALTANVLPGSATNRNVTWSTGSAAVATVDATSGMVTAKGLGTTYIYATTEDGSFKDSCEFSVESEILVTSIEVTPSSVQLSAGKTQQLVVKVLPEYAANTGVTFAVTDGDTATVSATGLVTAVANGTTSITVSAKDGSGVTANVPVVVAPVLVENVRLVPTSADITVGSTVALNPIISPSNADNQGVQWSSDDDGVASVSSTGVVKGEGAGTAIITVTTDDGGKTATCTVNVSIDNSIGESVLSDVILYPNPATSSITVGGLVEGEYSVKIFNTLGVVVASKENVTADDSVIEIDNLSVGLYILSIENDETIKVLRFQKGL